MSRRSKISNKAAQLLDKAQAQVRDAYIKVVSEESAAAVVSIRAAFQVLAEAEAELTGNAPRAF